MNWHTLISELKTSEKRILTQIFGNLNGWNYISYDGHTKITTQRLALPNDSKQLSGSEAIAIMGITRLLEQPAKPIQPAPPAVDVQKLMRQNDGLMEQLAFKDRSINELANRCKKLESELVEPTSTNEEKQSLIDGMNELHRQLEKARKPKVDWSNVREGIFALAQDTNTGTVEFLYKDKAYPRGKYRIIEKRPESRFSEEQLKAINMMAEALTEFGFKGVEEFVNTFIWSNKP